MSSRRLSFRRIWLNVHLWIGLGLGLLLVPLGLSGSLLVWHDDLDAWLHPQRYAVSGDIADRPLVDYLAAASTAFGPQAVPTTVRLPQEPGAPVTVAGRMAGEGRPRMLTAWLDPATARVLDTGEFGASLVGFLHRFHENLTVPQYSGRQIVGWLGVAMLASSLTGIWLWWPRGSAFRAALSWRRGRKLSVNLHLVMGIWIALPLAILSLTGIYLGFPATGRAALGALAPMSPPSPTGSRGGAPPAAPPVLSADAVRDIAFTGRPQARLLSLSLPSGQGRAWRVQLVPATGADPETVMVDDRTAAPLPGGQGAALQSGDRIARWIRRIHDGRDLGAWQVVIFAAGIGPAILGVTGPVMWLRRRRVRRALEARRTAALAGSAAE